MPNSLNINNQGVVYFDGVVTFSEIDGSTVGKVLTSNGTGVSPSFQPISATGDVVGPASAVDNDIVIFDGVTGKIIKDTGISSIAPTFAGNVSSLSTMTVPFDTTAGEGMYFSDGRNAFRQVGSGVANFFFGNSGNSTLSGIANTGVGQATLANLTVGIQNTGMGNGALNGSTSGGGNSAYGYFSSFGLQTGTGNCSFGWGAGQLNISSDFNSCLGFQALHSSTGNDNTAIGHSAGASITSGSNNCLLGSQSGSSYTSSESNNIIIGSGVTGIVSESNVTRIGAGGVQTACFIDGIAGVTVASAVPVVIDSLGQLGASTIGQTTVSSVVSGSAISLTTATPTNITSISLNAGTYEISGIVNFTGAITVTGAQLASVNTTSATIGTQGNNAVSSVVPTAGFLLGDNSVSIPSWILTIATTTTVFLIGQASFSLGTTSVYGRISAVKLS